MYELNNVKFLTNLIRDIFYILCRIGCGKKFIKQTYTTKIFYKKKHVKIILQTIPSHKFIIYVLTKQCKIFNQFTSRYFLRSYVMPMPDKSKSLKNEQKLLICVIENNNDNNILQPIPLHKFMIDL